MERGRACSIGLISDTHGLLRDEALAALAGSDAIIHAGDVGDPTILTTLSTIAPVTVVRGNIDIDAWASVLPLRATLRIGAVGIHVVHDVADHEASQTEGCRAIVCGHSHRPGIGERDGMLLVNPGSAGRRRFRLPVSVGRLRVRAGRIDAELVALLPSR